MKNARLLFAVILVGGAAACSAAEPTGPLPGSLRNSNFSGSGNDTLPILTKAPVDSTKQGG